MSTSWKRVRHSEFRSPGHKSHGYTHHISAIAVSKEDGSKWVIQDARNGIVWIFNSFTKEFKRMIRAHT